MKTKVMWVGFSSIFVVIGVVVFVLGLQSLFAAQASESWEQANGTVVYSEMGRNRSSDSGTTYSADVQYDYTVADILRSGDRVQFGSVSTSDSSDARKILRKFPKGKQVTVYYDPEDPDESVLIPGIQTTTWFLPGFGLVFALFGLVFVGIGIFVPEEKFSRGRLRHR